jgi:hypothetical protein
MPAFCAIALIISCTRNSFRIRWKKIELILQRNRPGVERLALPVGNGSFRTANNFDEMLSLAGNPVERKILAVAAALLTGYIGLRHFHIDLLREREMRPRCRPGKNFSKIQ